eukprot:CCRYP_004923-RH/>CCRYP_004923-RH protein AED:0.48 eAED:0.83 QI:0/0/0/1/0/0/2/0/80
MSSSFCWMLSQLLQLFRREFSASLVANIIVIPFQIDATRSIKTGCTTTIFSMQHRIDNQRTSPFIPMLTKRAIDTSRPLN